MRTANACCAPAPRYSSACVKTSMLRSICCLMHSIGQQERKHSSEARLLPVASWALRSSSTTRKSGAVRPNAHTAAAPAGPPPIITTSAFMEYRPFNSYGTVNDKGTIDVCPSTQYLRFFPPDARTFRQNLQFIALHTLGQFLTKEE